MIKDYTSEPIIEWGDDFDLSLCPEIGTSEKENLQIEKLKLEILRQKPILSIAETALYMGMGESRVREFIKKTKKLNCRVDINSTTYINRKKLDAYLDSITY